MPNSPANVRKIIVKMLEVPMSKRELRLAWSSSVPKPSLEELDDHFVELACLSKITCIDTRWKATPDHG